MGRGSGQVDQGLKVQTRLLADDDSYEGWITCDQGHDHWGLNGAAGLLLSHVDGDGIERFLLCLRSWDTQHGGTYSTPGGALGDETTLAGATREGQEELGVGLVFDHLSTTTDDHGRWAYHTVQGRVAQRTDDFVLNWELDGAGWFTEAEIDELPLHPGFKAYWVSRPR